MTFGGMNNVSICSGLIGQLGCIGNGLSFIGDDWSNMQSSSSSSLVGVSNSKSSFRLVGCFLLKNRTDIPGCFGDSASLSCKFVFLYILKHSHVPLHKLTHIEHKQPGQQTLMQTSIPKAMIMITIHMTTFNISFGR